ncbi:MAG: fluoride efflux transporter CrcB [Prevotella sp.]|nr:fluoride efflux transporter CrcB [Prevotella sp.]
MIRNLLLVALGGALGSVLRYLLSGINASFPWGTFAVNILGSLLIGLLVGMVSKGVLSPETKLLMVTGFCGGFTTFSTFASESLGMMKAGDVLLTALYVGTSVVIGILAVWGGMLLSELFTDTLR